MDFAYGYFIYLVMDKFGRLATVYAIESDFQLLVHVFYVCHNITVP